MTARDQLDADLLKLETDLSAVRAITMGLACLVDIANDLRRIADRLDDQVNVNTREDRREE